MDILVVDDDPTIRESTLIAIEDEDHYGEAAIDSASAIERLTEDKFDLVLLDLQLGEENGLEVLQVLRKKFPNLPVVMFTAHASFSTAVEATKMGAIDYLAKPFTLDQFRRTLTLAKKFNSMDQRIEQLEVAVKEVKSQSPSSEFESRDPVMKDVLDILFRAAATPATIIILGESGTGKSVVARAVHDRSSVAKKPFVTVSCPSLSKELLESELFGHVKGSFTGAIRDQWGKVKAAEGGTLFLDEIGELPMEIQPKLLRLLQEREYERLGENKVRNSDVRIIAATNRDLREQVKSGEFREDLFYRLNVISVAMPSLRTRPADLKHFATKFLKFFANQFARPIEGFSREAFDSVLNYPWPGNIRELRNVMERAAILAQGTEIKQADLPVNITNGEIDSRGNSDSGSPAITPGQRISLEDLEREHIRRIVASTKSLAEASDILGIDQATLYRKRKKFEMH
jgi:NtrC-family two-component system response regulator AlgB